MARPQLPNSLPSPVQSPTPRVGWGEGLQVRPGLRGVGEMLSLLRIQPSLGRLLGGQQGLLPGAWVPLAVRLECGSEEGARALAPVPSLLSTGPSYTAVSWSSRWIIW